MKKEEIVWFDDDPHPYILKKPYIYKTIIPCAKSFIIDGPDDIKSYSNVIFDENGVQKCEKIVKKCTRTCTSLTKNV